MYNHLTMDLKIKINNENIVNKSIYENIVKKLCISYEKNCEKVVLKLTSPEQIMNKL